MLFGKGNSPLLQKMIGVCDARDGPHVPAWWSQRWCLDSTGESEQCAQAVLGASQTRERLNKQLGGKGGGRTECVSGFSEELGLSVLGHVSNSESLGRFTLARRTPFI